MRDVRVTALPAPPAHRNRLAPARSPRAQRDGRAVVRPPKSEGMDCMFSRIRGALCRRTMVAAAAAFASLSLAGSAARAADAPAPVEEKVGSAYSLALSTTVTSHFISYGADVWGGGNNASPFSTRSTVFAEAILGINLWEDAASKQKLSAAIDIWSDNNNNTDSGIGGPIQEIDFNAALAYSIDKFTFKVNHGYWCYAGDEEKILDFVVVYSDGDSIVKGLSLNPQFKLHWRYDGNGGQNTGQAFCPHIEPTIVLMQDSKMPITVAFPLEVAIFSNGFQGGDNGFGYFNAAVNASVTIPDTIIPKKFGVWSASARLDFYHTDDDAIPNNPNENFFVTSISIGTGF